MFFFVHVSLWYLDCLKKKGPFLKMERWHSFLVNRVSFVSPLRNVKPFWRLWNETFAKCLSAWGTLCFSQLHYTGDATLQILFFSPGQILFTCVKRALPDALVCSHKVQNKYVVAGYRLVSQKRSGSLLIAFAGGHNVLSIALSFMIHIHLYTTITHSHTSPENDNHFWSIEMYQAPHFHREPQTIYILREKK